MRQYDAINLVAAAIKKDNLVEACFLKGSIARQEEDEYSDVDFYCLVSEDKLDLFLKKRLQYLQAYKPILYNSEVNFVGPQIVCVFEDGLHFDLYAVTKILPYDEIKSIYDPKNLLVDYRPQALSLNDEEVGEVVNNFAFTLLELYAAYKRQDHICGFRLSHFLFADYTRLLRSFKDPKKAKLCTKGFMKTLSEKDLHKYIYNTKLIKYETYLLGVKTLIVAMHELIINLPIKIAEKVNFDFFLYSKKLIFSIDEEKL